MNEFTMIYRGAQDPNVQFSPEQMQSILQQWRDWMMSIAEQDKMANPGNRLSFEGAVLKPNNVITDGPYVEIKEIISGYTIIKADTLADAIEIAKGCPILKADGSVEVRGVIPM